MNEPKNKQELIQFLAERDGISFEDAIILVEDTEQEISDTIDSGEATDFLDEALEDILMNNLGLEPDYLFLFV